MPDPITRYLLNYCRGCGREFPTFWLLLRHERKCEA